MKKLIISFKTPKKVLNDFTENLILARKGKLKTPHYELSFTNKKDFLLLAKNLDVLMTILSSKPDSVYQLAKLLHKDQSNLNKIISSFEKHGIIKLKKIKKNNRILNKPIVDFNKIEFDLAS